jgi:hypothetical protein
MNIVPAKFTEPMMLTTSLFEPMPPILSELGLITAGDQSAWAVTDQTNAYRYVLGRMWDKYFQDGDDWWNHDPIRPLWVFCMLNPSTARHDIDDPTVRKCVGFAKRGGAGGILIVNLMARSETHPAALAWALRNGINVVGPHNEAVLTWALSRPALMGLNIAAWGRIPPALRDVAQRSVVHIKSKGPKCFGRNIDGSPRHPLMLPYGTQLENL